MRNGSFVRQDDLLKQLGNRISSEELNSFMNSVEAALNHKINKAILLLIFIWPTVFLALGLYFEGRIGDIMMVIFVSTEIVMAYIGFMMIIGDNNWKEKFERVAKLRREDFKSRGVDFSLNKDP